LASVTVLIPFGKRSHSTRLSDDITFHELAFSLWSGTLFLTQQMVRFVLGCLESRRQAMAHDVVMIGGPNIASLPGFYARLTTPARFVLFIEAFWEDILPLQTSMSALQQVFWYRWYAALYRLFDAYIGGPSYKPDFYEGRGMRRDRIWPYIHQIDITALEEEGAKAELPKILWNVPDPWIVSIGRLEQEKLSRDCVAMARHLAASGVLFRLIMVGEGTERTALTAEIEQAGLVGRVILVGAQSNAVTYAIARRADYCFAPYMGTALVEVLLAGCAVVAYDNDPHRGIAGDGPIEFVRHGDAMGAAEVLGALLKDPNRSTALREATAGYARAKWNANAIGNAFVAPLIGRRDSSPGW
jgi:glycosyltransferase involved in cell wall biosynthesis